MSEFDSGYICKDYQIFQTPCICRVFMCFYMLAACHDYHLYHFHIVHMLWGWFVRTSGRPRGIENTETPAGTHSCKITSLTKLRTSRRVRRCPFWMGGKSDFTTLRSLSPQTPSKCKNVICPFGGSQELHRNQNKS